MHIISSTLCEARCEFYCNLKTFVWSETEYKILKFIEGFIYTVKHEFERTALFTYLILKHEVKITKKKTVFKRTKKTQSSKIKKNKFKMKHKCFIFFCCFMFLRLKIKNVCICERPLER